MTEDPLAEASNPRTTPARLQELAAEHPSAWTLILHNPNCYPELRVWVESRMAEQAPRTVEPAARRSEAPTSTRLPRASHQLNRRMLAWVLGAVLVLVSVGAAVALLGGSSPTACAVTAEDVEDALGIAVNVTQESGICYYDSADSGDRQLLIQMLEHGFITDEAGMPDRSGCYQTGKLEPAGDLAGIGSLSDFCVWNHDGYGVDMTLFSGAQVWAVSLVDNPSGDGPDEVLKTAIRVAGAINLRAITRASEL